MSIIPTFQKNIRNNNENKKIDNFMNNTKIQNTTKEEISIENTIENTNNDEKKPLNVYNMIIEIPKINLNKGIYDIDSIYNSLNYGIQVIETSKTPDIEKSRLILAGHNGNSSISYFDNLPKLELGDDIYIYYKGMKYKYILNNFYDEPKDGSIKIISEENKTSLILITCKKNTKDTQVVYVAYLEDISKY